ncbi:hypothetical protein DPMN_102122 [Dreissena polymorpha]|uniref:Uncharacterized protein n=1 Tax=Dreissena polymorpha TaxID=45954 RepID=A0A9D4LIN8_DREPO|nr:hypothetical protein DPMN_102122 [Dreissena polymorpha]
MKKKPWVTTEIMDLCDKRRELRHLQYNSLASRENYQKANMDLRKKMKEAMD